MKKWLVRIVEKNDKNRIKPNQLTIAALLLGVLAAIFIGISGYFAELYMIISAAICLLVSLILDVLDGILARLRGPTLFGGILDIFSDRLVEVSVIIGIVLTNPSYLAVAGLISVSSIVLCITIFLLMGNIKQESLSEKEKVIFYSRGLIERTETGIFLLVMISIPVELARLIIFCIFSLLILITAIQRILIAYQVLKTDENLKINNP